MANLSYEREEKFNRKFVESIEKVLVFIEGKNTTLPQDKIKIIRAYLQAPDSRMIGSNRTNGQLAEKELIELLDVLPQEIITVAKQFYKEQVVE